MSFFARGLFILTFLYPSVLKSSQNDMSGPDIGDFMVSEHVVFSHKKSKHPKSDSPVLSENLLGTQF